MPERIIAPTSRSTNNYYYYSYLLGLSLRHPGHKQTSPYTRLYTYLRSHRHTCVYTCLYTHLCTCIHACMHVYTSIYTDLYTSVHKCTHTFVPARRRYKCVVYDVARPTLVLVFEGSALEPSRRIVALFIGAVASLVGVRYFPTTPGCWAKPHGTVTPGIRRFVFFFWRFVLGAQFVPFSNYSLG